MNIDNLIFYKYIVISDNKESSFEERISEKLKNGRKLQGGVYVNSCGSYNHYYQAMTY